MKRFLIIVAFLASTILHADIHGLFVQGNEAYYNEDWDQAISLYEQSLHYGESDEQHFNLGNAYYQKKDFGRAILHYMKAEALNPANQDTQMNLQLIRKELELEPPEINILRSMAYLLSPNAWTFAMCIAFWMAFAMLLLPRVYKSIRHVVANTVMGLCALIIASSATSLSYFHAQKDLGVVLKDDAPLHVAPTESSPSNEELSEGVVAKVVKEHEGYYFIEGPDSQEGWTRKENFGLIWRKA